MCIGKLQLFLAISFMIYRQADDGSRYTFIAEWYDSEASVLRTFYLFYFPADDTVELFDLKNHRTFLKRTRCEGVHIKDINIGGTVKIYSRQMNITGFGDAYTNAKLAITKQRTFAMLKPDVLNKSGEIFKLIYKEGFRITKLKMVKLTPDNASEFYKEHKGKPFLVALVSYMTSGPVVAMELVAENAILKWRHFIGPTDSETARRDAPASLRARFGRDKTFNAVHGSDSPQAVETEVSFFFPDSRSLPRKALKSSAIFKNCTCCIIKPHAIREDLLGDIIIDIQDKGFNITAMEMFYLEKRSAEEFLEIYKGVVPEYPGMVGQLMSGPSVALEISGGNVDIPRIFRAAVGPSDPNIARQLFPATVRAKFGKDKLENAVHCTDLAEDGTLEVEYFFKILQ